MQRISETRDHSEPRVESRGRRELMPVFDEPSLGGGCAAVAAPSRIAFDALMNVRFRR
jgi:hypothetical protein